MSDNATALPDQTMTALQRIGVLAFAVAGPGMGRAYVDVHGFTADDLDDIIAAYPDRDMTVRDHPDGSGGPFRVVKITAGEGMVSAYGPLRATESTTFADHLAANAHTFSEVTR